MLISKKLLIASHIIKKQSNKKKLLGLIYSVIASSSIHSILIGCLLRQNYKKKLHLTHSFQVT